MLLQELAAYSRCVLPIALCPHLLRPLLSPHPLQVEESVCALSCRAAQVGGGKPRNLRKLLSPRRPWLRHALFRFTLALLECRLPWYPGSPAGQGGLQLRATVIRPRSRSELLVTPYGPQRALLRNHATLLRHALLALSIAPFVAGFWFFPRAIEAQLDPWL